MLLPPEPEPLTTVAAVVELELVPVVIVAPEPVVVPSAGPGGDVSALTRRLA